MLVNMANKLLKPLSNNMWKLDYVWKKIYEAIPVVRKLVWLQKIP